MYLVKRKVDNFKNVGIFLRKLAIDQLFKEILWILVFLGILSQVKLWNNLHDYGILRTLGIMGTLGILGTSVIFRTFESFYGGSFKIGIPASGAGGTCSPPAMPHQLQNQNI